MDSMVKNSGPSFAASFGHIIGSLLPAIFDITANPKQREPLHKLVNVWLDRSVFQPEVLLRVKTEMIASEQRRSLIPVPTGWPKIVRYLLTFHILFNSF